MRIVEELRSARDFVVQNAPVVGQRLERHYWRRFAGERANYLTYFGVYPDFASAAKDIPATVTAGFNHATGASLYLEQTHAILARDYPVVYWLGRLLSEGEDHVFDLGGNIGTKYYAFQHYLAFPAGLHWTVCELPVIARCGADWASRHDARGQLAFCTDPRQADGSDVLLASGSLQYLDYRLCDLLASLHAPPRDVLINVMPLHPEAAFFTLQKLGTTQCCVYRIEDRPDFIRSVEAQGYAARDEWSLPERSCEIPLHPERRVDRYYGFHFRRQGA